jgi:hypothetical protein
MNDALVTPAAFAVSIGVTRQAVQKAIKNGRLPAYSAAGVALDQLAKGRKFIKHNEAWELFRFSRAVISDSEVLSLNQEIDLLVSDDPAEVEPLASNPADSPSLVEARTIRETLQSDMLRLRLGEQRGELVPRALMLERFEEAGRRLGRAIGHLPAYAEEIAAEAQAGGAEAVAAWLAAKAIDLQREAAAALEMVLRAAVEAVEPE